MIPWNRSRVRLAIMCWLLVTSGGAMAQAKGGEAAVEELLTLSGARQQYNQMMTVMSNNMRQGFNQGFSSAIRDKPLDQEKQRKAQAIAEKHFQAFMDDLEGFIEKTMPWEKLVRDLYAPVYLKHFTVAEIKQVSAFYRTTAGKKFAERSPLLIQESASAVNEKYGSAINDFVIRGMRVRMQQIASELEDL